MKTTKYTLIAALAIFSAACQKENVHTDSAQEVIINATIEKAETKTVLGEGFTGTDGKVHHKVLWMKSDNISVFDGKDNNHRFISYAADNSEQAKFQKVANQYTAEEFVASEEYYAIYPGNSKNSFESDTKQFTAVAIDNNQKPIRNGFADDLAIAYGYGTSQYTSNEKTYVDMTFKNVTALIKFELTGNDITEVRFLDQNGAYLAGQAFSFTASDNGIEITPLTGGKKNMYMNDSVKNTDNTYTFNAIAPGVYYFVIVPPANPIKPRLSLATATSGNESTINSGYVVDKKGKNEIALRPGMILDLGKWNSKGPVVE